MFYSNSNSRKGKELEAQPHAAMVMHWAPLERQVRVEGRTEMLSSAESDDYFHSCVRIVLDITNTFSCCLLASATARNAAWFCTHCCVCSHCRRPRGSQIGAWVSKQSSVLRSREELDKAAQELEDQYSDGREVPRPPHWNGYRLIPSVIEFWQVRRCHIPTIPCDMYNN